MNPSSMPEPLPQLKKDESLVFFDELWGWLKSIAISFILVLILHWYVIALSPIEGHSMEPTLHDKEWLIVNKLVYRFHPPRLGDVIVLQEPGVLREEPFLLVKRVVAGPGDKVEIKDQQLYVNGEKVEETYTDSMIEDIAYFDPLTLSEHEFFVMGDNRHKLQSRDSRSFGPVHEQYIVGEAQFVIWPFSQWKRL